ncbi:MAG: GxxExxY protein [Chloroflexi bacterium]|nr:GxxExxY protein [Chloroflexota bacterium]
MPLSMQAPHSEITYRIIGAAMAVHSKIGPGHKEAVYQAMLTDEMALRGLAVEAERAVEIVVDDKVYGLLYLDHLVNEAVVVECKALAHLLTNEEIAQVVTYLAATGLPVGLLLNFGRRRLEYKRIFRPRKLDDWQAHIARFLWRPPQ